MADKKPVWVDESAHTILKEYAKLTKLRMVDVASDLVLNHIETLLEPANAKPAKAARAEEPSEPAPVPQTRVEAEPVRRAARPRPPRKAPRPNPDDTDVRYLGGVWLV